MLNSWKPGGIKGTGKNVCVGVADAEGARGVSGTNVGGGKGMRGNVVVVAVVSLLWCVVLRLTGGDQNLESGGCTGRANSEPGFTG